MRATIGRTVRGTALERPWAALSRRLRRVLDGPDTGPPTFVPPGHFYSPIPSQGDIAEYRDTMSAALPDRLGGIDLRLDDQVRLLSEFKAFYGDAPFPETRSDATRYWYQNSFFPYSDGLLLYFMLRRLEPAQVIEMGSGFSSAVMLDTSERFLDWAPQLTFIEPYPDRLRSLMRAGDGDRCRLVEQQAQRLPVSEFESLGEGDLLFVDSSHVSRIGSDVNHLFFEILPALRPGVTVHLHDIGYPFTYPLNFVEEGRAWNEAFLLRAFLEFNDDFEIVLYNDFLKHSVHDRIARDFPLWAKGFGLSFYMRRR
jgi:hypothetical protein